MISDPAEFVTNRKKQKPYSDFSEKTEKTKNRIATTVKKHKNRKKLEKNWKSMVKSEET
jgi:hypothetical protein